MLNGHRLSSFLITSQVFDDPITGEESIIVFSARTGAMRAVPEYSWASLMRENSEGLDELIEWMKENKLLVPKFEDELLIILDENKTAISNNRTLYAVIQPTASCQLGCVYCGQYHTNQSLARNDLDAITKRIAQKLDDGIFTSIEIGWFGAEPLLGLPVIEKLSCRLNDIAQSRNCTFKSMCVTNGLALSKKARDILTRSHVKYVEITVDGLPEFHDVRRPTKRSRATFDQIARNIEDAFADPHLSFNIGLRCNVDKQNSEGVIPFLDYMACRGWNKRLSRIYTAPVHSWGNDAHLMTGNLEDLAVLEVQWLAHMLSKGFRTSVLPARKPIVCMAVRPDAEVIDAYGNLYNCSEVSYVPAYAGIRDSHIDQVSIETLHKNNQWILGHVSCCTRIEDGGKLSAINDLIGQRVLPCSECKILPICGGSCPKMWVEKLNPCPTMKYNMETRLILNHLSANGSILVNNSDNS